MSSKLLIDADNFFFKRLYHFVLRQVSVVLVYLQAIASGCCQVLADEKVMSYFNLCACNYDQS